MGLRVIDKHWSKIFNTSHLFRDEAAFELKNGTSFTLNGFFASGTYGIRSEANYVREKAIVKHSFQCATMDLPCPVSDLDKAIITIDEAAYQVRRVMGGKSGVTVLELVEFKKKDGEDENRD